MRASFHTGATSAGMIIDSGCKMVLIGHSERRSYFGETDESIPMDVVETIKQKQPQAETYTYPGAAHGFYCDERGSYNKAAADLWSRTQEFLAKHMK